MKTTQTEDGATLNLMMMISNYIIFNTYKGFGVIENALMSLISNIYHSNRNSNEVRFTNKYASEKIGISTSTITRTIGKFVDKGYIRCEYDIDSNRIIYILNEPEIIQFENEE